MKIIGFRALIIFLSIAFGYFATFQVAAITAAVAFMLPLLAGILLTGKHNYLAFQCLISGGIFCLGDLATAMLMSENTLLGACLAFVLLMLLAGVSRIEAGFTIHRSKQKSQQAK